VKKITVFFVLALLLASCAPAQPLPPTAIVPTLVPTTAPVTAAPSAGDPGGIQHVFIVMMENHGYSQVWNTDRTPYITSLGNQFVRATNYRALIHPSLPNYLQLVGGDNFGITTDCQPSENCHVSGPSLADSLEAKDLTWKGYMESMPAPCTMKSSGDYAAKHNPFVYFDSIRNDPARCAAHVVPYPTLAIDLLSPGTTPNFAFISPNECNDMHSCPVDTGDTWLKGNLPAILNSAACTSDKCLVVLTWDEDDHAEGNQVLTIFAGSAAKTGGAASESAYTTYSLLHTVEQIFGVPTLGTNDAQAPVMTDMLKP
jgi:phospholipase C